MSLRDEAQQWRRENRFKNAHVPPEQRCTCCYAKKRHEYWTGQIVVELCDDCYELAKNGAIDKHLDHRYGKGSSGSSVHNMNGGLPTLGKRR